jgi:hypothetical protein
VTHPQFRSNSTKEKKPLQVYQPRKLVVRIWSGWHRNWKRRSGEYQERVITETSAPLVWKPQPLPNAVLLEMLLQSGLGLSEEPTPPGYHCMKQPWNHPNSAPVTIQRFPFSPKMVHHKRKPAGRVA